MEIVAQYSFWWMLPIVLLSLGLSALLYFRNARESFPLWVNISLGLFRFIVFALLGFLLLNPMLKNWKTEIQKPIIVFLQDESQSIALNADSAYYRHDYPKKVEQMIADLQNDYEVKTFSFADKLNPDIAFSYNGLSTNIAGAIKTIYNQYGHLNIGALIMATDGIYNQGQNPYYLSRKMKFPIYFIGLGDTLVQSDLMINRQAYNRTVFLGNKFPIEVEVISRKAAGTKTELQLIYKGKIIDRKKIQIKSAKQKDVIRFYPESKASGLQEYKLRLIPIDNEVNKQNNYIRLFVNVIDSKQKILILFDSPHPDIAAIKASLESHETYEVEEFQLNKFRKNIKAYNLVILHQLPNSSRASLQQLKIIKQARIPFLMILGSKTIFRNLNSLHLGLEIQNQRMSSNTVHAILNPSFSAFNLSDELQSGISNYPPLESPYGKYRVSMAVQSIFFQQIGSVKTKIPLIGVANQSGWRSGYIMGEGIWRWRLYDYSRFNNHEVFDELIGKIVRYLSLVKEQSEFDLEVKKQFEESEDVKFDAVLYNASYEPITDYEIQMVITDEEAKEYPYSFSKRDSSYYLNAGSFASGLYSYQAKVNMNGKMKIRKGRFTVSSSIREAMQLTADHHLLNMIADEHQAKVFDKNQIGQIAQEVSKREDIVSIQYNRLKYSDLIDVKWLLAIIVLLLAVEWFVRKQMGSY
jgi:hypothetical protein